ncbi:uncharacterized protein LOC124446451 [Xenia sp. Carnegie-2017]|uniref:uncharacterized protein LOC124446451 n=1 Tax=Xenia sp. Carnegie-2017 TaxID=2897299 RepID=UPI001F033593|nr:uncharacterized protein LOC124446451 [Xenia sp. Carnegie-2017]XP_046853257.1 uncharacterized protein LOC124446451 [Xenia sp. Carnegie-2017]XP_046853258.1 uncharacterized protein LOC124446451 [Xenia sp. Carnegie-2017]
MENFVLAEKSKNQLHKGQLLLKTFNEKIETRQQALYGNNLDSLRIAQQLYKTELEFVASKAVLDCLERESQTLEKTRLEKQSQLDTLYAKYRKIQDFEKIVQEKQNMIQILVKHNSDAKSKLNQQQTEILKTSQDKVCSHESEIKATVSCLKDSISKEVTSFVSLSLSHMMYLDINGRGRVPVSQLAINPLNHGLNMNSTMKNILVTLDFHDFMTSDMLLLKTDEIKTQINMEKERLKYNKVIYNSLSKTKAMNAVNDNHAKDLQNAVIEQLETEDKLLLPKIQENISKTTKALSECIVAMETVNSWWEQPAQYLVPWETVEGMNMRNWKDQWTVMTTRLRQLQTKK